MKSLLSFLFCAGCAPAAEVLLASALLEQSEVPVVASVIPRVELPEHWGRDLPCPTENEIREYLVLTPEEEEDNKRVRQVFYEAGFEGDAWVDIEMAFGTIGGGWVSYTPRRKATCWGSYRPAGESTMTTYDRDGSFLKVESYREHCECGLVVRINSDTGERMEAQ